MLQKHKCTSVCPLDCVTIFGYLSAIWLIFTPFCHKKFLFGYFSLFWKINKIPVLGGSVVERSNESVRLPTLPRRARVRNSPPSVILLLPSHIFKKLTEKVCTLFLRVLARRGEKRKRGCAEEGARREMLDKDNCRDGRFKNRKLRERGRAARRIYSRWRERC